MFHHAARPFLAFVLLPCVCAGLSGCSDQEKETKQETPHFNDRNRRPDPDFEYTYEIIDTLDVEQRHGAQNSQGRDAELLTVVDRDQVFLMSYSLEKGYIITYFKDDEKVLDFIEALQHCNSWGDSPRRSRSSSRIFYDQLTDEDPNYLLLRGEYLKHARSRSALCSISMTDFRDGFVDHIDKLLLTLQDAWDLAIHIKAALRALRS